MKATVQKIKLNGLNFILTDPEDDDSPIATIEQYQSGECSHAHLFRSYDKIMRFNQQIGTLKDIEFGKMIEIDVDESQFVDGLLGDTWQY